jgi:hypothetical protein
VSTPSEFRHLLDDPRDALLGAEESEEIPGQWERQRTLALVASEGVAYLVYWLVILILVTQAFLALLRPPEGDRQLGGAAAIVYLGWAVFCLAVGVRRGRDAEGDDRAPAVWLPVVTSIGCLLSLIGLRLSWGVMDPWPAEILVAGLVTVSVTVWAGPVAGAACTVLLSVVVVLFPLVFARSPDQLTTPLAVAVPGIALLAVGFAFSLAIGGMRRSAIQFQETLDERDEMLVRERTVHMSAHLAAEVERSLHDTALNTLETIAAHGDHLDQAVVAARCQADVETLSRWATSSSMVDLTQLTERLVDHARHLGLAIDIEVLEPRHPAPDPVAPGRNPRVLRSRATPPTAGARIPGPVLNALDGAAREALTNVAKHSGVHTATVSVRHEPDGVEVVITDTGVGPGASSPRRGFGLKSSVRERMAAAGGSTRIGHGPGGRGTQVVLGWWQDPEHDDVGPPLLVRAAEIMVAISLVFAAIPAAFIVVGWPGYAYPIAALVAALLPAAVAAWVLDQARSGVPISAAHVVAGCATYVLTGAVAIMADPSCSSLLGENAMLDARAPMLAVVLLLAPRWWVLAAQTGTVLFAHFGGALAWSGRWPACGPDTAGAGIYIVAALAAVWLFIGRITMLTEQFVLARREAAEAKVRIGAQVGVRAEQEAWVLATLTSAQVLLTDIAQGRRLVSDPEVREQCATEAQFLRGLLRVGRAPEPTRRPARIWLLLLRVSHCQVSVRGSFAQCTPPRAAIQQIGASIDAVSAMAKGCTVTLSAFDEATSGSLTLTAGGPTVLASRDPLAERIAILAPTAWRDVSDDTLTVEWTWPTTAADVEPRAD